ncbi:fluoride efflux transporter family protein [Corynebacterium pseudotuberculosis]|uniref:Fluoride-specific ion channel FluC n=1 Tax=Corynebacterium pseudotuberculosis 258 TaxID=1168865 RepID=A0AAU8PPS2_CORPS|nr:fluoride efflux transporter family protein [Corynebacterium pseudotuberculosis]AER69700.1 Protein crcB 1 [Corynebacterium pseudotuberculosis 1/06-A]AEQ07222.1 fluoride efflux transporter family protein [Corynebacterium pseudotuberculosis CIP 52.97]AFB73038.1 fluoride efflux transporter family protein [Corynebacterium pseudotuberculosis 316]AFH91485.2 fluoride efflux transporter family protein [Corynebacterium pseudotuberculosis 31]AFK17328.2 fluoride efflux transporter family protein [Coryn
MDRVPLSVVVGSGAALGAAARFLITSQVSLIDAPSTIMLINIVGATLMGYFRPSPFWGTGFLGGFTSFSAFALYLAAPQLSWFSATILFLSTVFGCVAGWILGNALAHRKTTAP